MGLILVTVALLVSCHCEHRSSRIYESPRHCFLRRFERYALDANNHGCGMAMVGGHRVGYLIRKQRSSASLSSVSTKLQKSTDLNDQHPDPLKPRKSFH